MINPRSAVPALLTRLWRTDRLLTLTGLLMAAALVVFSTGLRLDPQVVDGAPVWLKPAKFAASTSIYSLTLAWIFMFLPSWRRTRLVVARVTAAVFTIEVAIIAVQAWRGTTSHFNIATPLDGGLFAIMGIAIVVQTLASVLVAVALWREHIDDEAMGAALRAGMIITIVGAASAGLMTRMTDVQARQRHETGRVTRAGAHTVGGVDERAGLPVAGWSREHGDLRVPHFVGLHALQCLPVIAILLRRRLGARDAARAVRAAAASYAGLLAVLLVQALSAEPVLQPGGFTTVLFVMWAVATATALRAAFHSAPLASNHSALAGA